MTLRFRLTVAIAVTAGLALSLLTLSAWGQGCSMCKLTAEAGGEQTAKTLDYGIFILMTPTVVIFLGIFYWAFTRRDRSLSEQETEEEERAALLQTGSSAQLE